MRSIARVVFASAAFLTLSVAPVMAQRGGGGFHGGMVGGSHGPMMGGSHGGIMGLHVFQDGHFQDGHR